jgi:peptide/nickel transport system substrate-binding protein
MVGIQNFLREDGTVIQPYWRSLYRHSRPGIVGADSHPINEIHVHKLGLEA